MRLTRKGTDLIADGLRIVPRGLWLARGASNAVLVLSIAPDGKGDITRRGYWAAPFIRGGPSKTGICWRES